MDNCQEYTVTRGHVCADCFQSVVDYCNRIVSWAIGELRPATCQGCNAPIERLSDVIKEVAKL